MAFIFWLSSLTKTPDLSGGVDKNLHGLLYGGLGVLLARALAGGARRTVTPAHALGAVAIAVVYGVSDEFHQWFVPDRQADAFDVVADTIGAAVAAGLLVMWSRHRRAGDRRPV